MCIRDRGGVSDQLPALRLVFADADCFHEHRMVFYFPHQLSDSATALGLDKVRPAKGNALSALDAGVSEIKVRPPLPERITG